MLRNLLILLCITGCASAIAQPRVDAKQAEASKQTEAVVDYKLIGSPMPRLFLETYVDSSRLKGENAKEQSNKTEPRKPFITNEDLENKANLFVMMFNPTCSHCQDEAQLLERNMSLFKKSKVVMVANKYMKPYMQNFISQMKTEDYPIIYVGTDSNRRNGNDSTGFIDKVFLYSALPQINIYDKHRKLLKSFTGEVAIDSLKQYIE